MACALGVHSVVLTQQKYSPVGVWQGCVSADSSSDEGAVLVRSPGARDLKEWGSPAAREGGKPLSEEPAAASPASGKLTP